MNQAKQVCSLSKNRSHQEKQSKTPGRYKLKGNALKEPKSYPKGRLQDPSQNMQEELTSMKTDAPVKESHNPESTPKPKRPTITE